MKTAPKFLSAWSRIGSFGILLCFLLNAPAGAIAQCGSTVPGTSGNPFVLTIGEQGQCAANSLPVPNPNAQQQSNVTPLGCGATQQRDIWFTFTATANTTVISLNDVVVADMGLMVYDAPCAANMNLVGCAGYEYPAAFTIIRGAFNTVPGNDYFVRVSRRGNNAFQTGGIFPGPPNNMRLCGWSWVRPPDGPVCETSFEGSSGSPVGWTCQYGTYNYTWNFPNTGCLNPNGINAPVGAVNGAAEGIQEGDRHTIISDKLYLDPRTNFNVSGVAPRGGDRSFRLGNSNHGCGAPGTGGNLFGPPFSCPAKAESIRFPLTVTAANAGFTYMFAAVLQSPGHQGQENPRFETLITTATGETVSCGYFLFEAGSGLAQFNTGPAGWEYTDWTEVGLDLSPYIGQVITLEFRVAGCYPPQTSGAISAGPHTAYVYLDTYCQPFELESPSFCAGEASVEICAPAGFSNYSWPPGQPGMQPPLDQQCVTVLNPIAGTVYNVNMEFITGCATSTTVVLAGTPVTLTDDVLICAGQSVELNISVDDPTDGPYTFEWSTGDSGPNIEVAPTTTTTYTVVTTGQSGCGSAAEVTVEVESCIHVVTVEGGETCPGGCVDIVANISNDLFPPYSYSWTGGIPNEPGPHSVCPTETTTYTVSVTDNNGDVVTADVTVLILPVPELTFDVTDASCNGGADGEATVIPDAATAPYTHVWNTTPPQGAETATGLAVGTYTVTSTDANGCSSSADVTIGEPTVVTVSITTTPANCGEPDGTATATPAGGTGPYSFAWDTTPAQATEIATGVLAGPLSVTVTDANGCTATGSAVVTSIGGAELSTDITNVSCNGFTDGIATAIATNGTEPYTYSWNTIPPQATATATGLAPGTYTVTITEDNGCIGFAEVVISEPTAVVAEISTDPGSCGLPNGTATATASGGNGPYSFLWNSDPPQTEASATALLAGIYTVTVSDAAGCVGSASAEVINVPGPIAGFIATDVCLGTAIDFQNTTVNGVLWEWDMGDGTLYTQGSVTHTYDEAGSFTVALTATDASGCTDTFSNTVVVTPIPIAAFSGEPLQGCAPLSTAFENMGTSVGATCLWQFGDGNSSTDCNGPVHLYQNAGCYDVTLTVTEAGCFSTMTVPQMVCVDPVPVADFSITPNPVLTTSPRVLYLDASVGAQSYAWSFVGGSPESSTDPSVGVDYAGMEPGDYEVCLAVANSAGCTDTLCRTLILRDELRVYVPNSFTPDGDGINDVFIPVMLGFDPDVYLLSIFNRWGELIFQTKDPAVGWDGTVSGTKAQDGVYVWKLRAKTSIGAEVKDYTGHVTLLR